MVEPTAPVHAAPDPPEPAVGQLAIALVAEAIADHEPDMDSNGIFLGYCECHERFRTLTEHAEHRAKAVITAMAAASDHLTGAPGQVVTNPDGEIGQKMIEAWNRG